MKNKELGAILHGLDKVSKLGNARFSYAVIKNMKIISEELETIKKTLEPSEKYKEYDRLRVELCEKYCDKDENGKPKLVEFPNGTSAYSFKKDSKKFNSEIEKLQKEHKEAIDEYKKQEADYNELLEQDVDIKFFEIKYDILPDDIRELLFPIFELVEKIEQ